MVKFDPVGVSEIQGRVSTKALVSTNTKAFTLVFVQNTNMVLCFVGFVTKLNDKFGVLCF